MIGSVLKLVAFFATTAVAVPYTTALLCNLAYGWPQVPKRYRRAFCPKKVYALNLAVIQQMMLVVRFLPLYLQFRTYYRNAAASEIMKDRTFGRNSQKLDLYFPKQRGHGEGKSYPVVIFVYGGAWGSGSKKMYGMVCAAIANRLGAIVCCPDYSTYPKGHVNNMIEDLVDCVTWLHNNVEHYSGDKSNIMMVGHSSGAHLCFMSLHELLTSNSSIMPVIDAQTLTRTSMSDKPDKTLEFTDKHFGGSSSNSGDETETAASSGTFCVVNKTGTNDVNGEQIDSNDLPVLSSQISETALSEASLLESDLEELMKTSDTSLRYRGSQNVSKSSSEEFAKEKKDGSEEFAEGCLGEKKGSSEEFLQEEDDSGDDDSVITVVKPDDPLEAPEMFLQDERLDMVEMGKSVKAVIGMAGVYHIADHFKHESKRGVEDLSTMAKAMYGPEQFDRYSPSCLYDNPSQPIRLPKIVLLHGTDDFVVPLTSTTKFGEVLEKYNSNVVVRIVPNCDHYEICLDLNKPSRKYHQTVMTILDDTAKSVFT